MAVTKTSFQGRQGHVYIDKPPHGRATQAGMPGQGVAPGPGEQSDIDRPSTSTLPQGTRQPSGGTLSVLVGGRVAGDQNGPTADSGGPAGAVSRYSETGPRRAGTAQPMGAGNPAGTGAAGATPAGPPHSGTLGARPSAYSSTGSGKGTASVRRYGSAGVAPAGLTTPGGNLGRTGPSSGR